ASPEARLLRAVQACAGRLGAAALSPPLSPAAGGGQHLRPGKASSAVFLDKAFSNVAIRALARRSNDMTQVLKGLRVVEHGTFITGPAASMMLADMGAEVVKVELPGSGDPFRAFKGGLYSPHYQTYNRNKRSEEHTSELQ